ncbi:hypothetical protein LOTGIDRAFT_237823 [Lottia gigantea]|uniref:EGF-like domain-containing protein n=1 Tax=Lottia gigantea TaxID=225164 RepID=V4CLN6_LOTGI|nr:hypothetical protein LOTGIDRAFT_237823 [Lottia gigantea]ESP03220.1 hypothetical protein LOTGIDRAFT_237823 [Lottia gigantea]
MGFQVGLCELGPWNEWCEDNVKIASYLTPFKFFGTDKRRAKIYAQMNFYKQFPQPPLKQLHKRVTAACDKGVVPCMVEIKNTAVQSRAFQPSVGQFHPFPTELEEFQYKLSASYYMCYFTVNRKSSLRHILAGANCLEKIQGSGLIQDFTSNPKYFTLRDVRTDQVPFQCAELFYCPEPCYALSSHGLMSYYYDKDTDTSNPCHDIEYNKECKWMEGANTDIYSLMAGKFNFTCNCQEGTESGYEWNLKYKICVDVDECFTKQATCPRNQLCINTKGSYFCHCKRGFKYNAARNICEEDNSVINFAELRKKKKIKSSEMTFRKQLEILIGLRSSIVIVKPSLIVNIFAVFICFQVLLY